MNKVIRTTLIMIAAGLCACSGGEKDYRVKPDVQKAPVVKKAVQVKPVLIEEEQQLQRYTVRGQRDPFQPYELSIPEIQRAQKEALSPLQKITLSQIEIVGIIQGLEQNRALLQDSSGQGFIIIEGTLLGENSGIVTAIASDRMVVKQHFKDYMGRVNTREVVLSLRKEEGDK